jgi:hypothetical protein
VIDWAYLRGMMVTATGWTLPQVDRTPLPEVWELFEFWNEWPPAHVLLRGFTGYEPKMRRACPDPAKRDEGRELPVSELGPLTAMIGPAEPPPAHIAGMVAWAEQMKSKLGAT